MNLQQINPIINDQTILPEYGISAHCFYPGYSREKVSELPVELAATMLSDANILERYHNEYENLQGHVITEGIDPCCGPKGFTQAILDESPIGPISYETYLILPWLMRMNKSLKSHGICTVQSQPAYYNNQIDPAFRSYFQVPFVDFAGPINAIGIYQQIESDDRLSNCFFETFYTKDKKTKEITIRFCIMRPFTDVYGQVNSGFTDTDFWEQVCTVCEDFKS